MSSRRSRCFLVLALSSLPAVAEERRGNDPVEAVEKGSVDRAKASFRAGAAAYAAGDYLAAIQALETAYELAPLPAIAFSLGQAERRQYFVDHERGHLDRAIQLFRRYVDELPGGGRRADALDALSQLEPLAAALGQARPAQSTKRVHTRLMVVSPAPGSRISVDGGAVAASPLIREVSPGKHRARVEAPGFFPADRDVTAIAGELILTEVPLHERPSILVVWTRKDAELYVDGAFIGVGGGRVAAELPSGVHHLTVAEKGYEVAHRTLLLGRGETAAVRVALEPTAQRWASRVLFVGGGVALGAALLLGTFAVRAEDRAEDFLGKQARQNVTEADLAAYRDAIRDRNLLRATAIATLSAAGSLFVTGALLHEFDHPGLREFRGGSGNRIPSDPKDASANRLRVAPLVGGGAYGATIDVGF